MVNNMSDTYVLIHGAWHNGELLEPVAHAMRAHGHTVHCPTLAGNRPADDRAKSGLTEAVQSVVSYIESYNLKNVRLVGHSYGGMIISKVADLIPDRITRLVYWNAFVPLSGECLNDMVPPHYKGMFDQIAAASNNAVVLPFPVWREAFINDADAELAQSAYDKLNPQPYKCFTEPVDLTSQMAEKMVGKSYLNFQQDAALPHSHPWHPRLSERLGLLRLIEGQGSHEVCFTNPKLLGEKIIEAGRD